jgi:hypothetical protein
VSLDPTPASGTLSPQLTDDVGVATFADIPATTYTVTGTITITGVNYLGTATVENPAPGSSAAVTLTLVAVTP